MKLALSFFLKKEFVEMWHTGQNQYVSKAFVATKDGRSALRQKKIKTNTAISFYLVF